VVPITATSGEYFVDSIRREARISTSAVSITGVGYTYGSHRAIEDLSLQVASGDVFALLGPNGSGKTTLFRLIATLLPMQRGEICVCHADVRRDPARVRARLGVVFQTPSIDLQLTVRENLFCQAVLHGLPSATRKGRMDEALEQLGLADRAEDRAAKLSGGLRRRLDLARGILSRPDVLLLDEPTTALDPAARSDMWKYLRSVCDQSGTTIVFTTHLLEEADHADRIAIIDLGRQLVCDTPATLKASVGGDVVSIQTTGDIQELANEIRSEFQHPLSVDAGAIRIECQAGHEWVPRLVQQFPHRVQSITVSKPTLEDVFIRHTGHRFWVKSGETGERKRGVR